jgi:hypothetical protein
MREARTLQWIKHATELGGLYWYVVNGGCLLYESSSLMTRKSSSAKAAWSCRNTSGCCSARKSSIVDGPGKLIASAIRWNILLIIGAQVAT